MKRDIHDKKELVKLVSFLVMGDGGVYFPSDRKDRPGAINNAFFMMNMLAKHKDYVEKALGILLNVTHGKITPRVMSNKDGVYRQPQLTLKTNRHPMFTDIRSRVYVDKYKSIDPHALTQLDWESISFLYMSDGCLGQYFRPNIGMVNPSYSVTLNLKRLSYGDQILLKRALEEKRMGVWNIGRQKSYCYLRLRMKFVDEFMENIAPFIVPSFQYKLKSSFRTIGSTLEVDGDIVYSSQKCEESSRNDLTLQDTSEE